MPHAIWTGLIGFGLVTIPVHLVAAVREQRVRFHQFHQADSGRIQYRRICEKDGREVPYEQVVRGYKLPGDQVALISQDELDRLEPKRTRTIEIDQFIGLEEIDPIYYDTTYYLLPTQGGEKPYRLLLQAMAHTGKVAIGSFVMRDREHVVAIRPSGDVLVLETLFYEPDVVRQEDLEQIPKSEVGDRERRLAQQVIDAMVEPFKPERYRDEFSAKVEDLARRKVEGKKVVLVEETGKQPAVADLMTALQRSVDAAKKQHREKARPTQRR
jgi:DNA end-binding protein Ku